MVSHATRVRLLVCALIASLVAGCTVVRTTGDTALGVMEIPYLTNRAIASDADQQLRYSTNTAGVSAGVCSLTPDARGNRGPRLESYRVQSVEDLYSGFEHDSDDGLLVYVHGYNIGVRRACEDAARLAIQTGYEGRLVLFSWPASRAGVTYRKDARRMTESISSIVESLETLRDRFGGENISVVTHSMGSRAVTEELANSPLGDEPLDNLVLVASDIDREVFEQSLEVLRPHYNDISVLVTDRDHMLLLSQVSNASQRLGRAVDSEFEGVAVFDVSEYSKLGLGNHEYHLSSKPVGEIMREILAN